MAAITERTDKNGRTKYTVRIRIRGQEPQTATFGRRTDAVQWVQLMESDIRMGKRIPTCEARNGKKDPRPYIDMSGIFHRYSNPHRGWLGRDKKKARNFMSYVKRSKNVIGDEGIHRQLRRHRRTIRKTLDKEIAAAMRD